MPVTAIAGRPVFDDIAGEHHVLVRHMDDGIARRMGASDVFDIHAAAAQIDGHAVAECGCRPRQAGDGFIPFKQAREPLEFTVPVLLPTFGHHAARRIRHDDIVRAIGRGPQHAHRMIVGQNDVADWFVGDAAHPFNHLFGQTRGGLGLDDHDRFVTDNHTGIRVALGGKGIKPLANLVEGDLLFGHVALGCECFCHDVFL